MRVARDALVAELVIDIDLGRSLVNKVGFVQDEQWHHTVQVRGPKEAIDNEPVRLWCRCDDDHQNRHVCGEQLASAALIRPREFCLTRLHRIHEPVLVVALRARDHVVAAHRAQRATTCAGGHSPSVSKFEFHAPPESGADDGRVLLCFAGVWHLS